MGLALVLCDSIIEDKVTGKKTLVGIFDRLFTKRLPCVHPSMAFFVSVTSGRGEYPCRLTCTHTDAATVAFELKGEVKMKEPAQVVDLVFRLNNVRFAKDGRYWIQFSMDDVPIMVRPLVVEKREPPAGRKEG
jgi:hypothetical protein